MTEQFPRPVPGPSIHEFVLERLDPAGRLADPGLSLPDEDAVMSGGLRWVAGAIDGVLGHGFGGSEATDRAAAVAGLLAAACADPTGPTLAALYAAVREDDVLDFLDAALEQVAERGPDRAALHAVGRWLATTAADRGAVKVGIAVLGLTGPGDDVGVVRALGAHEEFTLYAAVALTNGLAEPESELWALASAVHGWGRIHCVERLRGTRDPEIRAWILRHGFRNSIMYEYLAHLAATTGGLLEALRAEHVDRELLTAAGEILDALVQGGPAEDLDDYPDGAAAVEAFLGHLVTRAETLGDFHAVVAIGSFLDQEDGEQERGWPARAARGWTPARRQALRGRCAEILERPGWTERISAGLSSEDPAEFWRANQAARLRGVDTFALHVARIHADPLGTSWYDAWAQADGDRAEQLAELAGELLPLDRIVAGPGPDWRESTALDWSLQALRDHPGVGPELLLTGLRSPVVRHRNMSLRALERWPAAVWPDGARRLVDELAMADPEQPTRERAAAVLAGEPPPRP